MNVPLYLWESDSVTLWSPAGSSVNGFSRQDYWRRLPCPPFGDLPYPGIELMSLISPALKGRLLTTSSTWEVRLRGSSIFIFLRNRHSFFNSGCKNALEDAKIAWNIPSNSVRVFPFCTSLLVTGCLFDRCEVISHCGFDLHSPDN